MAPGTIDDVLTELDAIILRARNERSRLGYFATLYRNVTLKVKQGIAAGFFEDGARMERLDVTFAGRYLTALGNYRTHQNTSRCWIAAFETANRWSPIILQQLLIGMNAHINFDLGIAAQTVAPGSELASLETDFNRINNILASMVVKVRSDVEQVSPWIKLLDSYTSQTEDRLIEFSLSKARTSAWLVANMVNSTPTDKLGRELEILDEGVTKLGGLIASPKGFLLKLGLRVIRLRESNDVPHVIDVLSET
jgi:hypothetical protein